MTKSRADLRKRQAERELAVTDVRAGVAFALTALLLATVFSVPIIEESLRRLSAAAERSAPPLAELPRALGEAFATAGTDGLIAADRVLLEAIDRAEERLEDESFLRAGLLPRVQALLLGTTGLGNEQVYPGREGWLFYRADVDHVTGRGFLQPTILRQRERAGDSWDRPPQPDPTIALVELHRDLAALGIELVVMPTPVKPSVEPGRFAAPAERSEAGLRNASFGRLLRELDRAGIAVFDPLPELLAASQGGPAYLRTDTHWAPAAMERVATALAARLEGDFDLGPSESAYLDRPVTVEGRGDLFTMLRLPGPDRLVPLERITVRTVTDAFGSIWRPSPQARVLLLGDSFTNVFSDARLGWGAGAGLAERLAFHLQRPVDRIAQNAGGAHASREALAREPERLGNTRVVIYQFAERELSFGDWRSVGLLKSPSQIPDL